MTVRTSRSKAVRNSDWNKVKGGVTAPKGYLATGICSGIKEKGLDLAVILSSQPASAAGVFTRNRVQAAPVVLSKQHLKLSKGRMRAILINSGCANACTGTRGLKDSRVSARYLASHLKISMLLYLPSLCGTSLSLGRYPVNTLPPSAPSNPDPATKELKSTAIYSVPFFFAY